MLNPDTIDPVANFDRLAAQLSTAKTEIARTVRGQDTVIDEVLITVLAGGHGLLVGVPGVAKTTLVKTISTVLGLGSRRIQFTPDLMPADILGSEILQTAADGARRFVFAPGPVFTQLLMADEINRASPRTQAALLEAMQEQTVTTAGEARALPTPFHVLATQNPIEQEGTYPLPEAQLDRFMLQINMDYPSAATEREVIMATTGPAQQSATAVLDVSDILAAQAMVRSLPVPETVLDAIVNLVRSARPAGEGSDIRWGPGPRAGQALLLAAKARALLAGRPVPLLADVLALAKPVLRHRIQLGYGARSKGKNIDTLIDDFAARL